MTEAIKKLARRGELVAYFGYGSLVNRATLSASVVDASPARLSGWARRWRPRPDMPGFPAALLTVSRSQGAAMDGLVVFDRRENLETVDRREARYHRREIDPADVSTHKKIPSGCPLYVYEAMEELPVHREPPRILRSYLNVVMQGFLVEHGIGGVGRFVAETADFHVPIHEDSHAPVYPRHVAISDTERDLFHSLLVDRKAPASE